ncbi:MAG: CARDB domain-containing protein, partial [Planctomycetaceae bacterium]
KYAIWTRDLSVTVHNIGSKAVKNARVTFYETDADSTDDPVNADRRIGEAVISYLSWPMDPCPKTQTVAVPYIPTEPSISITAVVDESESVVELSETNNRATRLLKLSLDDVRAPRNRLGEVGGDASREIRRGIR